MKLIEASGISFSYQNKAVLESVDFELCQGDVLSLVGRNGCGKTTLLKILLGIYKSAGKIEIYSKDIQSYSSCELARLISYVPQTHQIPFDYTVFELVLMGRLPHTPFFASYSKMDRQIAMESLERVGIVHLKDQIYSKISGGERQLAFIARALAQNAKIIFLDEPVTGLDYGNQFKLLDFLKDLSKDGYSFVQTTHYPDHALYSSNKILMLKDGRVLGAGSIDEYLTPQNIQVLYGVAVKIVKDESGYSYCIPVAD